MRTIFLAFILFFAFHNALIGQSPDVYINEFIADQTEGIRDEFEEYSDWLELYNGGTSVINLAGYSLTDDPTDSAKWRFPELMLNPGQYLHLFASGRDIFNLPVIWNTVIDRGDEWRYIVQQKMISS